MADFDDTEADPAALGSTPWADCRVTTDAADPTTIKDGDVVDGVTVATGDRILRRGSAVAAGIYEVGALDSERAEDADEPGDFVTGRTVKVTAGTANLRGTYHFPTATPVDVDTDSLTFNRVAADASTLGAAAAFDNTGAVAATLPH